MRAVLKPITLHAQLRAEPLVCRPLSGDWHRLGSHLQVQQTPASPAGGQRTAAAGWPGAWCLSAAC